VNSFYLDIEKVYPFAQEVFSRILCIKVCLYFLHVLLTFIQIYVIIYLAGWSSSVARLAHNQEVGGSNPSPATILFELTPARILAGGGFLSDKKIMWKTILTYVAGAILFTVGLITLITVFVNPTLPQEIVETTKDNVTQIQREVSTQLNDESGEGLGQWVDGRWTGIPSIYLGDAGGSQRVDACDGTFTRMTSYDEIENLQDWYSAHNGCGGSEILYLEPGSKFNLNRDGVWETWELVEYRRIPQVGSNTSAAAGMSGELIVQTCYWDDATMKVASIAPSVTVKQPKPVS
jgi:hypothetical protein